MEMLFATAVMLLVAAGAASLTIGTVRTFSRTSSETDTSTDVATALQYLTRDLQEAKQVDIQSASYIRVYFPVTNADGSYDRSVVDTVHYTDYYRANSRGNDSATGSYFVRRKSGEVPQFISYDVDNIAFESPSPGSVDVTVSVLKSQGNIGCSMIHRAIFMRNY